MNPFPFGRMILKMGHSLTHCEAQFCILLNKHPNTAAGIPAPTQALLSTGLYNLARDGDNEKITDYFKQHTTYFEKFPTSETAFGEGKLHS